VCGMIGEMHWDDEWDDGVTTSGQPPGSAPTVID